MRKRKNTPIKLNKIAFMDYDLTTDINGRCVLSRAVLAFGDGYSVSFYDDGEDVRNELFHYLADCGVLYVFVYDCRNFGCVCEYYAMSGEMPKYDRAYKNNNSVAVECWNELHTGDGILCFRMSMRRRKLISRNRGGKVGQMHTFEFRGLRPYILQDTLPHACSGLGVDYDTENVAKTGLDCLFAVAREYENITGVTFLTGDFLRHVYTVGGAAKNMLLSLRYPTAANPLRMYQKEHYIGRELEDYFRDRELLLGGMCFFNPNYRGILFDRSNTEKKLYKYDVNGLYSWSAKECGEIGYPCTVSIEDYEANKNNEKYVYILVIKNFLFTRQNHMPCVFGSPFEHNHGDDEYAPTIGIRGEFNGLYITGKEYAIFGVLFEELKNFYDIEECEIVEVVRFEKFKDDAIIQYNDALTEIKNRATVENNKTMRLLAKVFKNIVNGKFLQYCVYNEVFQTYDEIDDIVRDEKIIIGYDDDTGRPIYQKIDNWEDGHFDYVRGAYIYTMARVKVMRDIRQNLGANPLRHHFYTDTDSIITDIQLPENMVDKLQEGKYKLECVMDGFAVIGKKTYVEIFADGTREVVCAGINKEALTQQLQKYEQLSNADFVEAIQSNQFFAPRWFKWSGGAKLFQEPFTLGGAEIEKIFKKF